MSYFHFQPMPSPGREGAGAPPPAPAQPAPGSSAPAEGAPPPSGGGGFDPTLILMFAVPFLLIFFMNRGQGKKQKQFEESLKVGDKVITRAGLLGRVVDVGPRAMKLEIAPGVNVQVLRSAIESIDAGDGKPAAAKPEGKEAVKPQEKKA